MLNIRNNKGICVLVVLSFCATVAALFFSVNTSTTAQTSYRVRVSTPGYYYIKPADISQNPQTAAITLTNDNVVDYAEGLQVVFKTEVANTNNANVTLRINRLEAKNLLTRHGQQFRILEMDAGIMMTATYDGAAFISDYVAARSIKGRPVATLGIAAGSYNALQYVGAWTLETGVTGFSVEDIPGGITFGNPNPAVDALLALPTDRASDSQLGWFIEVLNGTTVVNTIFKNFGSYDAFGTRVATDAAGIVFEFDFRANGLGQTSPYMAFLMVGSDAIPAGYSIKVYLSEN